MLAETLHIPGEHALILPGVEGTLEAKLTVPEQPHRQYVALLGHPHSLQGGTMQNKVVTTMARVFNELHIPSLRFNFRGVGLSEGSYDAGIGESEDMIALARAWPAETPPVFIFAGFSFGSYVAYRAAQAFPQSRLITIAPPVHHYDYTEPVDVHSWLIVQGDQDEVVPLPLVVDFAKSRPSIALIPFTETGHFFHGKLVALKEQLLDYHRVREPLL